MDDRLNASHSLPDANGSVLSRAHKLTILKDGERVDEAVVAMELSLFLHPFGGVLPQPDDTIVARTGKVGIAGMPFCELGGESAEGAHDVWGLDGGVRHYRRKAPRGLGILLSTLLKVKDANVGVGTTGDDGVVVEGKHSPDTSRRASGVMVEKPCRLVVLPNDASRVPAPRHNVRSARRGIEGADVSLVSKQLSGVVVDILGVANVDDQVGARVHDTVVGGAVFALFGKDGDRVEVLLGARGNRGRLKASRCAGGSFPEANGAVSRAGCDDVGGGKGNGPDL